MPDSTAVSLDPYRTPDVGVFSGFNRGKLVGQAILEEHLTEADQSVTVEVPEDVYYISNGFRHGLLSVLPNATFDYAETTL
jgi:hypothetical protein